MKSALKRFFYLCGIYRGRLCFAAAQAAVPLLFQLFKGDRAVMNFVTDNITYPLRAALAFICSFTEWSVAEWLVLFAALFSLSFLVSFAVSLIRRRKAVSLILFGYLSFAVSVTLGTAAAMTLLWNVNYYADGFSEKSGIAVTESGTDELAETAFLFASLLSKASDNVARDENGLFAEDIDAAFRLSKTLYRNIEAEFPFLKGHEFQVKKVLFSKALSAVETTGVAFPFTGEATVNIDQPAAFIPATIAHETAHQRRIASEQEANFAAVLACEASGDAAYIYSGRLLAYTHLANALAKENYELYVRAAALLPDGVNADLEANREYWRRYESKVSEASDSIYDAYLKDNGQTLGIKSYGAVVDLLIAYYNP